MARRLVLAVAVLVAVTLLPYVPAWAEPGAAGLPRERSTPVTQVRPKNAPPPGQTEEDLWTPPAPIEWPDAASVLVEVEPEGDPVDVGGLPVAARPVAAVAGRSASDAGDVPDRVRVEVLERSAAEAAGAAVLMRVSRADGETGDGAARLEVGYGDLVEAFGGAYGGRLRLVLLPECAAEPVEESDCPGVIDLGSVNDPIAEVVSADLPVVPEPARSGGGLMSGSGGVVALMAGSASDAGTFQKSSLASSASWQAGQSGGGFTWSYPVRVPPAPGGLAPDISFTYSSASVDGRTNGENTQPSWMGEGWSFEAPFIERSYRACAEDLANSPRWTNATADLCWRDQNATLMMGGRSSEIILGDDGRWRLADDDGSRLELLTSGTVTGYHNNEHWRLTTSDGTQYWFGRTRLPGWSSGVRETGSVWGVPVFSNHNGEPCLSTTNFLASRCQMAWRWNLDYVVDTSGNSMSYWYNRVGNVTALVGRQEWQTGYHRDGWLGRIEYGTRAGSELPDTPPMQVVFAAGDRCLTSCGTQASPNTANWPDTPWDLKCTGNPCPNNMSPTFWSSHRLASVTTQVKVGGAFADVDHWTLGHTFPATMESATLTFPSLWLDRIKHEGRVGGTASVPDVTTAGTRYANRTDHNVSAGVAVTNKYRLTRLTLGTGGYVNITYENSDCTATSLPDPDHNAMRCFPQRYTPPGSPAGWAWWNKYRVTQVTEEDAVGGSPLVVHKYAYSTAGSSTNVLWHHDDAAWSLPLDKRSWSDFRGWPTVTVTRGADGGTKTESKYLYFRGMHADRTDAGEGTRTATVTASSGVAVNDENSYAGMLREETHYASPGGQALFKTLYGPWRQQTGQRVEPATHAQPTTFRSYYVGVQHENDYEWVAATSSWRQRNIVRTFDSTYGMVSRIEDHGDAAVTGDETCTRYEYTRNSVPWNTSPWITDTVSRTESVGVACSTTPTYPQDLLSDGRTYYDGATSHTTAPTKGLPTKAENAASHTGTTPGYITTSTATYDALGRSLSTSDALGRTSTTVYTPATGVLTSITATNPAGHATTMNLDIHRGQPTTVVDPNGRTSTANYDPLGRLTKIWLPGTATSDTPDTEYTYTLSASAPNHIQTRQIGPNGNQISSFEIYDGLLRPRQTQTTAPDGNRVIADTQYDSRGLPVKVSTFYNDASGPTATLAGVTDSLVNTQTRYTHDGLERVTAEALWSLNTLKWQTTTTYDGDRVNITPPAGGTATTTIDDIFGRTTALRRYTAATPTGTYDQTTYTYDKADRLVGVTDPAGNDWTYSYDLRGRETSRTDPDAGTSTSTYDNAGQVITTTDSRGETLHNTYDSLGRRTHLRDDSATGTLRASWLFDTIADGLPTSSTRHLGTDQYTVGVTGYTDRYAPIGNTISIPASEGNLAGSHTITHTYKPDGALATTALPAVGGLPAENLTYGYNNAGLSTTLTTPATGYVNDTTYHWDGQVKELTYRNTANRRVRINKQVDPASRRLTQIGIDSEHPTTAGTFTNRATSNYYTDPAGNITALVHSTDTVVDQVECFRYDHLRRLTSAWTEAAHGCTTPQRAGADPYRLSWTYDNVGNRVTQTSHTATGSTTATSTYPTPGGPQPHALTQVAHTGQATHTNTYGYDTAGNTTTRTIDGTTQTLTWDPEGRLATTTQTGLTTSYLYDADGNRLIRRDNTGTTLYLGQNELLLKPDNQVDGTRYYTHAGNTVAVRTVTGVTRLATDHHGTHTHAIDSNTAPATITRRRTLPFGEPNGTTPTGWPGTRGYLGAPTDPTGLTHLGAREYDPTTGRFISVDPLFVSGDPGQHNAYQYGRNSPVTFSDPSGLRVPPEDLGMLGGYSGNGSSGRAGSGPYAGGSDWATGGRSGSGHKPKIGKVVKRDDDLVRIGKHVVVHRNDPNYQALQEAYDYYSGWGNCFWLCTEYKIWGDICMSTELCPEDFAADVLDLTLQINGQGPFDGVGQILFGSIGADDGFTRSLTNPASMQGATEAEVRAMVPRDWKEAPLGKGEGRKFGTPPTRNKAFGERGWVEFNRGVPNSADPLHQAPFIRVTVGGLNYRAAAKGNPAIERGQGLQISSNGNPGPGLKGARDILRRGPFRR
ncbi:RHS repeat domain-containing protein [Polymorphospora rubra]|uniref:RHS repeat domain-containing protein n=1 Tax=Polymorphospora rubra TaxID=338584 RepID=UPI0033CAF8B6